MPPPHAFWTNERMNLVLKILREELAKPDPAVKTVNGKRVRFIPAGSGSLDERLAKILTERLGITIRKPQVNTATGYLVQRGFLQQGRNGHFTIERWVVMDGKFKHLPQRGTKNTW